MSDSDLCCGFLLGFLTAGVIGFIFGRILLLRKPAAAAGKKTAFVETKASPKEVYMTSIRAQTETIFWILVLIAIVIAVVWIYLSS